MGYSGATFDPEKVDLYFESAAGKLQIIENGVAVGLQRGRGNQRSFPSLHVTAIADVKMGECIRHRMGL